LDKWKILREKLSSDLDSAHGISYGGQTKDVAVDLSCGSDEINENACVIFVGKRLGERPPGII
jgi:hypothetical protein